jgi:phosphoglycolate phosphatase-like HAD superfamily hydrolase
MGSFRYACVSPWVDLKAKLPTLQLKRFTEAELRTMIGTLLQAAADGLAMADQALEIVQNRQEVIERLRAEKGKAIAANAHLANQLAQARGQRTTLRVVPGDRELLDDDPPEPPDAA